MKLATTPHPRYPKAWLDKATAETMLSNQQIYPRLSVTRCKRNGIAVSSTGHIRRRDLERYITDVNAAAEEIF